MVNHKKILSATLSSMHSKQLNTIPCTLFHYTSKDSLKGILSEHKPSLYFSQYDALNDPTERQDVLTVLRRVCNNLVRRRKMSKMLRDDIASIQLSDQFLITHQFNEINEPNISLPKVYMKSEDCYTYICSFSKNKDSLPMWQMYSKSKQKEGYCIGFSRSAFSQNCYYGKSFSIDLVRVIYNEEEKEKLIENQISSFCKYYDAASKEEKNIFLAYTKNLLYNFQFVYKNSAYAYEEEIRAVLHIPKSKSHCENIVSERKYRTSNGLIVPYVVYTLPENSVNNITTSPMFTENTTSTSLQEHLSSIGIKHVRIDASKIPIRNV